MNNKQIEKILEEINNETDKRVEYANSIIERENIINGTQLDDYESLLNIDGQNQMIPLLDFHDINSDVTPKIIADKMKELKCMYFQPFKKDGKMYNAGIPRLPYLDISLIPYIDDDGEIIIEKDIVISPGIEKILQDVCDEAREHDEMDNLF